MRIAGKQGNYINADQILKSNTKMSKGGEAYPKKFAKFDH